MHLSQIMTLNPQFQKVDEDIDEGCEALLRSSRCGSLKWYSVEDGQLVFKLVHLGGGLPQMLRSICVMDHLF